MVVPDQHNRPGNAPQKLIEKKDHVFAAQFLSKGLDRQFHFRPRGLNKKEHTEQVQSLMVVQIGVGTRCLANRCPTAAEWRNQ